MKLIIIRHGETPWNARHRVQGLSDQPLSKEGLWQAELLCGRFAKTDIDAIYSSTLKRAKQTAQEVGKPHPHVPIITDKILNEMDWGEWEGLTFSQIKRKFPKEFLKRQEDKFHFAPKNGESPSDLKKRLTPFLKKIVKKHKGQTVLIVGHGGVNRVLMGILMGWDGKRITDVLSKNTAVNILHVREGKSRLHLFNCTKHLEM